MLSNNDKQQTTNKNISLNNILLWSGCAPMFDINESSDHIVTEMCL